MADRYTYFPLIGVFIALAWAVPDCLLRRPSARAGAAVGVLTARAALTWIQLGYGSDEESLWRRALAVNEQNAVAHECLGIVVYPRGEVDEAERHFLRAILVAPNYDLPYSSLGTSRLRQGASMRR